MHVPTIENATFRMEIDDEGLLAFWFKRPVEDHAARQIVSSFVNSWQGQRIFQTGDGRCDFFEHDVNYSNGSGSTVLLVTHLQVAGPRAEANTREQSPWLFHEFEDYPKTSNLIQRFQRFISGQEPLQGAAYYCWTALKEWFGSEQSISSQLNVSNNVLESLARLMAAGDEQTVRKIASRVQIRPLTEPERFWIESTLRLLIERAGIKERDPSASFSLVTLSGLPPLRNSE